ncbi:MAG TPA: L-histidine N(alpha)-methyltransferase, partial [Dehalococcoidia bacterium]|nr:L-histidine N(alpha)-methyltransferase [Dehalococcoidia bacterium]
RRGLTSTPKKLLPKYFYDAHGSELFEQITEVPEYYPMRAESALLQANAGEIMASLAPEEIVELGSGSSTKTRILLDAQDTSRAVKSYVPMDVSESIVRLAADELHERYPDLAIHGVIGDFERHLHKLPPATGTRLVLFLGSTIGNLEPEPRIVLLSAIRGLLGPEGHLLLGTDLVKDVDVLERAYNDAAGVTAAFNLNILKVINNGLQGDFRTEAYKHVAFYNREFSRIEMHLKPMIPQTAHLKAIDLTVELRTDETIWTESSHKFTRESVSDMLQAAGMKLDAWYTGEEPAFGLSLASPA